MAKCEFCYLYLTCANTVEATEISRVLLEKRLIACAKQLSVDSHFHWKGSIDHNNEVMLIMDSRLDLFDEAEKEVAKLHSYETFVLTAVPLVKVSKDAESWMNKELKHGIK